MGYIVREKPFKSRYTIVSLYPVYQLRCGINVNVQTAFDLLKANLTIEWLQ